VKTVVPLSISLCQKSVGNDPYFIQILQHFLASSGERNSFYAQKNERTVSTYALIAIMDRKIDQTSKEIWVMETQAGGNSQTKSKVRLEILHEKQKFENRALAKISTNDTFDYLHQARDSSIKVSYKTAL